MTKEKPLRGRWQADSGNRSEGLSCQRTARGHRDVEVLKGWRKMIVGDELLDFLEGRITLSMKDGSVCIESGKG